MFDVKKIISRADERTIGQILGNQLLKLVQTVEPKYQSSSEIKKLIFLLHPEKEFLNNKKLRSILIDLLKPEEIRLIADTLGFLNSNEKNYYSFLKKKNIIAGSQDELLLFNFFNMVPTYRKSEVMNFSAREPLKGGYELFPHQREAINNIEKKLRVYPHRVLLHMPTGSGKTRTAMNLISEYLRKSEPTLVIWMASTEELCTQAFKEFQKAWSYLGNRNIGIARLWGKNHLDEITIEDGIIIAGFQKLTHYLSNVAGQKSLSAISRKISFIVVDEAHQSIAERYQSVIEIIYNSNPNTKLLGLSATPGRTWNDVDEDQKLADFYNRQKVTLSIDGYSNPVNYLIDYGYISKVNYKNLEYTTDTKVAEQFEKYISTDIKDYSKEVLSLLGQDSNRNLEIISEVINLIYNHKRILLFAPSVESSETIATVLRIKGINADSITSTTNIEIRRNIIEQFKSDDENVKVICNYGVLTTGFDAPNTSAVVIARPTLSLVLYSQMVGRGIRGEKAGGNKTAEVVTVVDTELPGFRNVSDAFYNWEDVWE